MDGNGRWARQRNLPIIAGHKAGAEAARDITKTAIEHGIKYLTLYTFSSENWHRSQEWIDDLFGLLRWYLRYEIASLHTNNIRLMSIGDRDRLPDDVRKLIHSAEEKTKNNTALTVVLALSYGARDEIVRATKKIINDIQNGKHLELTEDVFASYLDTKNVPDPDLLIRTSGELRLSNYLLWQLAYAEFIFIDMYWPDFTPAEFTKALYEFTNRQRRFGKNTSHYDTIP
jgi:undecaprenyl diphosphate synthase